MTCRLACDGGCVANGAECTVFVEIETMLAVQAETQAAIDEEFATERAIERWDADNNGGSP